jgi:DNA-binding NarL/FixJ family response regulator
VILAKQVIMEKTTRVMAVDDHRIVLEGLSAIIESDPNLNLVAALDCGQRALDEYDLHAPDVVLLDLRMPKPSGIETLVRLMKHDPGARVLMLSSQSSDDAKANALSLGAVGYLLKTMPASFILSSIHAARRAHALPLASLSHQLAQHSQLSERELEVLTYVAHGNSNKQIAAPMSISEHTVKNHVNHIIEKLNATDRTHAVTRAFQRGVLNLDTQERS